MALFPGSGRGSLRRAELRRTLRRPTFDLRSFVQRPEFVNTVGLAVLFTAILATIEIWALDHHKVYSGQIMPETRQVRVDFTVHNELATNQARRDARRRAPTVFVLDPERLASLREPLINLPVIVGVNTDIEGLSPQIRMEFGLDAASLPALRAYAVDGTETGPWRSWVDTLVDRLRRHPIVDDTNDWQDALNRPTPPIFQADDGRPLATREDVIVNRADSTEELAERLRPIVVAAGFPDSVVPHIVTRLAWKPQATFQFDATETAQRADAHVEAVDPIFDPHIKGETIYVRGDQLSRAQFELVEAEASAYRAEEPRGRRWLERAGLAGVLLGITVFLAGYVATFYPRIPRNPFRLTAICALMAAMLGVAAVVATKTPQAAAFGATASTLFIAVMILLAYDQRLALFISGIQCVLVTVALGETITFGLLLLAGCGLLIIQLPEIRNRGLLIRAAAVTSIAFAAGSIVTGLVEIPLVEGAFRQITIEAAWNAAAAFGVGFLILGILPTIERVFNITTGLTLVELRDPQHPLLRQLQQKAPGTYNHSLQIANIGEAAAEAIGASGLLAYVGALYHDIGKMNKPAYFVENQADGINKHDNLRPEMSLLVIVAHVKDGIELAREYHLPRQIRHLIESHHGTTLVEYFYHAARTKAEAEGDSPVEEIAFRYPGPKPHTREAAILMLADAVESATRTMSEPTPSRIESLVRSLARKRLEDGQFDECDLTFRELRVIEDSIIKSVTAIHHSRISYPDAEEAEEKGEAGVVATA